MKEARFFGKNTAAFIFSGELNIFISDDCFKEKGL
jgi:hypothetical protein